MTILFGHPTGNPNSHHAALAHFDAGRLEAFCVPWMPSEGTLRALRAVGLGMRAERLARRHFAPLADAPLIQGRLGELRRLAIRAAGRGTEALSYEANDWLMSTMARHCARSAVTAVHAYEDCSYLQFEQAKRLGRACIYDLPIGYYDAWKQRGPELFRQYSEWIAPGEQLFSPFARPDQKRREMELADLVLVPSGFVESTVRAFHPSKKIVRAPYGVDLEFWSPAQRTTPRRMLKVVYAGQQTIRKGIPMLVSAWRDAALEDAELTLIGRWLLSPSKLDSLSGILQAGPCSREVLREHLRSADLFVIPSYSEGLALVVLEAMGCGIPVIVTEATGAADLVTPSTGWVIPTGNPDALVEALREAGRKRDELPSMGRAARSRVEDQATWARYRQAVADAVADYA